MAKGTVDFRFDRDHDVVIARPRWTLEAPSEVMRWYQLHATYFGGRFSSPKSLITVNEEFDVVPQVATLWGQYRAKLHESFVSSSVAVNSNARVRLTTNTSGARYGIGALERATVEEAIQVIAAQKAAAEQDEASRSVRPSSIRMPAVDVRPSAQQRKTKD